MLLADVTSDHVQTVMDIVMEKVGEKSMAPRTARHIYATDEVDVEGPQAGAHHSLQFGHLTNCLGMLTEILHGERQPCLLAAR